MWYLLLICKVHDMFLHMQGLLQMSKVIFKRQYEGCLSVHLLHEIMWNANLMQQGNFIDIFLARHVSGTYSHHQKH